MFEKNKKKSILNIGSSISTGKQLYEASVGRRALERAGKNKNLHGHINEILTMDKINQNPINILSGKKAVLTKSKTAIRDDIIIKKGGKVVKRLQLKDTSSPSGLQNTINKVKQHHYKGTNLVGTKETTKLFSAKTAKNPSITQKMKSNGISSDRNKLIAAKTTGQCIKGTKKYIISQSLETGINSAKLTAGFETIKAGLDIKNGKKSIGNAAGTIANETAISVASAITGDTVGSTIAIATAPIIGPASSIVGAAAGMGASTVADIAIRKGESIALNKHN